MQQFGGHALDAWIEGDHVADASAFGRSDIEGLISSQGGPDTQLGFDLVRGQDEQRRGRGRIRRGSLELNSGLLECRLVRGVELAPK